eukprot:COSAG06_NODE_32472_length_505_cov_1.534483_1_plen_131_part_10
MHQNLFDLGPDRILARLQITRAQLDEALLGGGMDLVLTIMKDVTHARHDGVGAVFKELGDHILSVGRGGGGLGAPPPLPSLGGGASPSRYVLQNRQMPIEVGTTAYVHIDGNGRRYAFPPVSCTCCTCCCD